MSKTVTAYQGEPLDLVLWRHRGSTQDISATIEANADVIAASQVFLEGGQVISLPSASQKPQTDQTIQLWD